jgi:uncharacterized cupin superfamily protein
VVLVNEARLERTEHGTVARSDGWFVLNAREAQWGDRGPRGLICDFEAGQDWPQLGFSLFVLRPEQPMSMYHWETDQEDFLVVSGEALLIIEGEERPLRQWDFVHCPPHAAHVIVGAGDGPAVIVAVGSRQHQAGDDWGAYPVHEAAARHNAAAEEETNDPKVAYARFPARQVRAYEDGWLPDL